MYTNRFVRKIATAITGGALLGVPHDQKANANLKEALHAQLNGSALPNLPKTLNEWLKLAESTFHRIEAFDAKLGIAKDEHNFAKMAKPLQQDVKGVALNEQGFPVGYLEMSKDQLSAFILLLSEGRLVHGEGDMLMLAKEFPRSSVRKSHVVPIPTEFMKEKNEIIEDLLRLRYAVPQLIEVTNEQRASKERIWAENERKIKKDRIAAVGSPESLSDIATQLDKLKSEIGDFDHVLECHMRAMDLLHKNIGLTREKPLSAIIDIAIEEVELLTDSARLGEWDTFDAMRDNVAASYGMMDQMLRKIRYRRSYEFLGSDQDPSLNKDELAKKKPALNGEYLKEVTDKATNMLEKIETLQQLTSDMARNMQPKKDR